ncbi:hypothetical protein [Novilysobacter longmucuonensis]|uniref:hypothetical protein n=1 Tax=Novilysobacter longmucuonensis TaxID=3098603 RepID=UPI002FC6B853
MDFGALLAEWPQVVAGPLGPIGASAFGDLFFQRQDGAVERLDVLEGGVHLVADNFEAFQRLMNDPQWQETNLLTSGIALLYERGVRRGPGQFYGFAPHPALTGRIEWGHVMPLDALVWHSVCSQTLSSPA